MRASGRGLQPTGVRVRDKADFKIYTEGAGEGTPEVRIIGPGKHYILLENLHSVQVIMPHTNIHKHANSCCFQLQN